MIPSNISREHLIQAIEEIDKNGVPEDTAPTRFYVIHNGKHYPPKYLISIANKYANGKELKPLTFHSGEEANPFLRDRGFEIILIPEREKPFDDRLKNYLEDIYPNVKVDKVKRSWLRLRDSATIVYVNGSRLHEANNEGWYDLELKIYNELVAETSPSPRYYAVILGSPDTTFVLPKEKIKDIFQGQPSVQSDPDAKKNPRWMFTIFQKDENYVLRLNRSGATEIIIQPYLNNWSQIKDFKEKSNSNNSQNAPAMFVTGYDERNLEISKQNNILGWKNNSQFLSKGSVVFVFNKTTLKIETGFEVKSRSNDISSLIWADEIDAKEPIYKNRWNAEVIYDDLNIRLDEISKIEPFNQEPFQGLLRGNFPMPLSTPHNKDKYSIFRQFLINKTKSITNHWIFIVTDKPELGLSADEIYKTRMADRFWGLNKSTPFRKTIKKGDKVIFCYGAKKFIGSATLDSDSFELDEDERIKFSHEVGYTAEYGVKLTDIDTWQKARPVTEALAYLPFIKKKDQYRAYFQGGIRQISKQEYDVIVEGNDGSLPILPTNPLIESGPQMREFDDIGLSIPNQSAIEEALNKINEELLVDRNIVMQIAISLISGRHVLLAGPVGTGKTTLARLISKLFWKDSANNENGYYADIHTATAEWSSQDVIGGIMPRIQNGSPTYEIVLGCVSETVAGNWSNSNSQRRVAHSRNDELYRGIWLVIDEFNRADIDKAFGQLFTALETRILKVPTTEGKSAFTEVRIPQDYRIIGTLNTADKHYLFKLSDALKRRFAYIVLPAPSRQKRDTEIYYALKNAIKDITNNNNNNSDYHDLIVLDDSLKTIDPNKSNTDFIKSINQAYDILDFVRTVKPLGTAILKSIYQTMLVACKVMGDFRSAFDMSVNSNLLPQLENVNVTSLQTIQNFFFGDALSFFREKYSSNERERYASDFKSFLLFIQAKNPEARTSDFIVQKINEEGWTSIKERFDQSRRQIDGPLFNSALQDVIRSSIL